VHLPVKQIVVASEEWVKLNRDVWSKQFVQATLLEGGRVETVKIRYRGGHTREYPKKSYEIQLTNRTIHLNAEYDDPSMIRNSLSFTFFEWIGVPSPSTEHCILQINGENFGVYLEVEGVDASFFHRRDIPCIALMYGGNDDANFSLINPDTNKLKHSLFDGYEQVMGGRAGRKRLENFIFEINTLKTGVLYEYLQSKVDIENYLTWVAGAVCTGNYDGFNQNYAIYQSDPGYLYRMIPWDYEGTWGRNCFGERCSSESVRVQGYNILTKKVMAYKHFRRRYKEILQKILDSSFTLNRLKCEVEFMMANIRSDIESDTARKYPIEMFDNELAVILSHIRRRRQSIRQAIKLL
jgi:spore coat protein H